MTSLGHVAAALLRFVFANAAQAQVPGLLNYQGRVAVGSVNSGQFKFAMVNASGSSTYCSNDGTSAAGSHPTAAVPLTATSTWISPSTMARATTQPLGWHRFGRGRPLPPPRSPITSTAGLDSRLPRILTQPTPTLRS